MESELSQAYYGVYCSSKEILKNNQRHLYCSMLDLLTSTCKTTGLVGSKIVSDEMIEFWLLDILPLMFDTDRAIQTKSVEAFEQGLTSMDVKTIHSSKQWPSLKSSLSNTHAPKIHKLREDRNHHWHRVWGFMIRILDKELLKGASTINSFLSIVELGFRSTDNTIRAESFLCWRLLIEIFAKYDELSSPKRLKLICIPLKSSQSKSAQAAEVKMRVWWYLLTCFGDKLGQHFEAVVEPFLIFCFGGSTSTKTVVCAVQQYQVVRELAMPCLIKLLSTERNEFIDRSLRDHKLEVMNVPSPLLEMETLEKHWLPLINGAVEAMRLMASESSETEVSEQHLFQQLLRQLLQITLRKDIIKLTIKVCTSLTQMLTNNPRVVITAMNTLASEGITLKKSSENLDLYPQLLEAFAGLFISARSIVPPAILQRCVDQVFSLEVQETGRNKWRTLAIMLEKIVVLKDDEDYEAFETKLIIWRKVSKGMLEHLRENTLDVRVKMNAALMDNWILWPVQLCVGFAGRRSNNSFDQSFCALWRQLINSGQNSPDRRVFLSKVYKVLMELLKARHEESSFGELFDAYVAAVIKLECDKDNKQHQEFFLLMQEILKQQLPKKPLEACLNTLRNALVGFKNFELTKNFDSIKPTIAAAVQLNAKGSISPIENKFLDDWKRAVMDKLRSHPNKEMFQQMKDLLKGNNEVFVVIPSVWSMNPDKLTERQKEKMAEKANIPALYNDMSQSQEASLKPWTPKKIIIAQKDKSEIVLEGPEQEPEEIINDSETPVVVEKEPEPKVVGTPISKKSLRNHSKQQTLTIKEDTEEIKKTETELVRSTRNSKRPLPATEDEPKEKMLNQDESIIKRQTRRSGLRNKNDNKKPEDVQEEKTKTTAVEKIQQAEKLSKSPTKSSSKIIPASEDLFKDHDDAPCMVTDKENILQQQETQLGTMPDPAQSSVITTAALSAAPVEIVTEEKLPTEKIIEIKDKKDQASKKTETVDDALPTELIDLNSKTNTIAEIIQAKEVSPKKTIPKYIPLSSPPDRKLTNNSSSPTLRPKPSSHLTGRGAQLINMIRNKKVDMSASTAPYSPAPASTPSHTRNPAAELMELTGTDQTSTPIQHKDLLVFSKRLPSPTASPSASILKRKLRRDSIEDLSFDSPAFKRKRVSFHDPPVSITKEYLRDTDETKTKPKRCLIMDKVSEAKHALRRRSKLDSLIEIEKYNNPTDSNNDNKTIITPKAANTMIATATTCSTSTTPTCSTSANKTTETAMDDSSITSLKWIDSRNTSDGPTTSNPSTTNIVNNEDAHAAIDPPSIHVCQHPEPQELDIETATKMVLEQCSLDAILEKYFAAENTPQLKSSNIVSKFLSNAMATNSKIKANVLETLSENHSKDFLDHAVQENLSSVVCDRLNLNSVIDYICAKSKINAGCRNNLLQQIPDILKHSKNEIERFDFIKNLVTQSNFSDEHILEIIALLMQFRSRVKGEQASMVSESAVDSSSNL